MHRVDLLAFLEDPTIPDMGKVAVRFSLHLGFPCHLPSFHVR